MAKEPSVFWRPQAKQLQYDANMFYFNVYIQQKTIVKTYRQHWHIRLIFNKTVELMMHSKHPISDSSYQITLEKTL